MSLNTIFKDYIRKECTGAFLSYPVCKLTDTQIDNFVYFLENVLPKCKNINISNDDIKNGKIINKGGMGYTFLVKDKIIKICICSRDLPAHIIKNEIKIHEELQKANNSNFIKLFGYYIKDGDKYKYFDHLNNFENSLCETNDYTRFCELYIILEAGESSLYDYLYKPNYIDYVKNVNIISLINLLKFYKINDYFINKNELFLHCDIKKMNCVVMKNGSLKLIDFGISIKTNAFFNFTNRGTPYTQDLLYNDDINFLYYNFVKNNSKSFYIQSPLYDMFSVCVLICDFICKDLIMTQIGNLDVIVNYINLYTKKYYSSDIQNLIENITKLMLFIRNFHKKNLDDYFYNYDYNYNLSSDENYKLYIELTDMKNLICPQIGISNPPKYGNGDTKLKKDYNYFCDIVKYFIPQLK
jgi:hypothetical protein